MGRSVVPKVKRNLSRVTRDATELLGLMIRSARLERNMTASDLAARAGVSRPLLARVEKGDTGVAIGSVFEIAVILGVPLFEPDDDILTFRLQAERRSGALMRKRAFHTCNRKVDDDF